MQLPPEFNAKALLNFIKKKNEGNKYFEMRTKVEIAPSLNI